MDLCFTQISVCFRANSKRQRIPTVPTGDSYYREGERGEITLPLILTIVLAGFLMSSLLWLNKFYETQTKEHLYGFQNRWNALEKKYQD